MRDASIHIKRSDLIKYFEDYFDDAEKLVDDLLIKTKKYRLKNRKLILANKTLATKLNKQSIVSQELIDRFAFLLNSHREDLYHKNIVPIRTAQLKTTLANVTENAINFCTDFKLDFNEGFLMYIKHGISLMGRKYSLNKFITYHDKIVKNYSEYFDFSNDENKEVTKDIYNYYCNVLNLISGKEIEVELSVDFVYCSEIIVKNIWNIMDYIDAQFKEMKQYNIVPEPYQLHTPKAIERFKKYMRNKPKDSFDETYRKFLNKRK